MSRMTSPPLCQVIVVGGGFPPHTACLWCFTTGLICSVRLVWNSPGSLYPSLYAATNQPMSYFWVVNHSFEWYILELGYFPSQCQLEGPYSLHVSNLHSKTPERVSSTQDVPARVPSVKQDSFTKYAFYFKSINCARFETMPGSAQDWLCCPGPVHLLL